MCVDNIYYGWKLFGCFNIVGKSKILRFGRVLSNWGEGRESYSLVG